MRKCLKIRVLGKVQGVAYREAVQKKAKKLAIEGTICNMDDGSVVVQVCGNSDVLDDLIDILYQGSPQSKVLSVVAESLGNEKDFRGVFRVIG
jgi:acylphosphatase